MNEEKSDVCVVTRWQIIKRTLNNLNHQLFVEKATEDKNAIVLDVRTKKEYDDFHLDNASNLNYLSQNLADELEALDLSKNFYIYCRTGRRSLRVCVILQNMGVEQVYNLEEGIANLL